jgi:hypothetical protein
MNRVAPLRTVWVLGAGFSRSLGGPLLPDLFRQENRADLAARYPTLKCGDLADACWRAQILFNWGRMVERQWLDAEQFIDFVDCATERSPQAALLSRMTREAFLLDSSGNRIQSGADLQFPDLCSIKSGVIRALAAECSWFASGPILGTERWSPYRSWLASLDGHLHTVVSFNYDQVIERIADESGASVLLPHEADQRGARPRVLKLHGSVTWRREGTGVSREDPQVTLGLEGIHFAIGTPGQTKREMKDALFEPLWRQAEFAIKHAEAIIFLGYRFPETDGDARRRILTAIRSNDRQHLRVHVVLGPDINSPDAIRMRRLLEICTRGRARLAGPRGHEIFPSHSSIEINPEPLLAQDFLALYAEDGPLSQCPLRWQPLNEAQPTR